MNLDNYLQQRLLRQANEPRYRELCTACMQASFSCYCGDIVCFDPGMDFVILIHPLEMKRRIATGRMSHRCLLGSFLLAGRDFSADDRVEEILNDPRRYSVMLYPGAQAIDLTRFSPHERAQIFPQDRRLTVFVVDGTWRTVRPMVRSTNLAKLPKISFSLERPSGFQKVRKQPALGCFSTIEAIHQTIELIGPSCGFAVESGHHNVLLKLFKTMVARQTEFVKTSRSRWHDRGPSCQ
jgi:DTW domain-containing protein YfiP